MGCTMISKVKLLASVVAMTGLHRNRKDTEIALYGRRESRFGFKRSESLSVANTVPPNSCEGILIMTFYKYLHHSSRGELLASTF